MFCGFCMDEPCTCGRETNEKKFEVTERYDLLVMFDTKAQEPWTIHNVENYGVYDEHSFYYVKNGFRSFLSRDYILFIGRKLDYEN